MTDATDRRSERDPSNPVTRANPRRGRVAHLAGSMYVVTAVTIVSSPVVARSIGPEGRGEYAAAYVWGLIAFALLGSGLPSAVLHFAGKRDLSEGQLLAAAIRFGLMLVAPAAVVGTVVVGFVLADLSEETRIAAFVLIMLAPLRMIGQSQRSLLTARGELRPITIVAVLPALFIALVATSLAVLGRLTLGNYLLITVVIEVATTAVWWAALPVRPTGPVPTGDVLAFGVRSHFGFLAEFSARRLDQAVLAAIVIPAQLGFYAIAATVASLPNILGNAVSTRAFSSVEDGESGLGQAAVASRIFRELVAATTVSALAIGVASPIVLPALWGEPFRASIVPLLLLLPGSIALGVMGLCRNYLIIANRPTATSVAQGAGVVCTVVGLAILAPIWGIGAAAIVSSVSYIVIVAAMLFLLRSEGLHDLRPTRHDLGSVVGQGLQLVTALTQRKRAGAGPG